MRKLVPFMLTAALATLAAPTPDGPPPLPAGADGSLLPHGIYASNAPVASETAALATALPLVLGKGNRIAFVGNTLLDRAQSEGHLESALQQSFPALGLTFRNLAWSADEVDLQPRPDNFASQLQHLTHTKADIVIAAWGFNESFRGIEAVPEFKTRLRAWVDSIVTHAFNGSSGPQLVLLSPTANEDVQGVRAATLNNDRLAAYSQAMREVAEEKRVGFIDLFEPTRRAFGRGGIPFTINGVHLTVEGDRLVADIIHRELTGKPAPQRNEELRKAVIDKDAQHFRRYRPLNTFYYTGGRNKDYGYLDFLPAMRNFDLMTANRDRRIHEIAQGATFAGRPVDDSNLPPLEAVTQGKGANEWLEPDGELSAFKVDPRFEVNLFASEKQFPELARPIQMRWDARGRLWVSCSTTYPHIYPGSEPNDKIIILEDTDKDGRADKCTVWADRLHIPLSFELTAKGAYVSEQPHLTLIEDTDGDGKADRREKILTGFGCEDSHHSLHDFVWTPDGDLQIRESIFHHSQIETAYGPVRLKNSGWFQFTPASQRLTAFGSYPSTNPWGVTFDQWGNHVASHPIFANAFSAANPAYPAQHPAAGKLPAYSGTCGQEFIDFPMWPADLQGCFVKARYKPTNRIELHQWLEKEDHYEENYLGDLLFSSNLSFIPVDVGFGPRGDLFVCDWYNPVKGHAQYSLRDPRRDRTSGRIWRIVPKGAVLQEPPAIAGTPIPTLLENLTRQESRYRYWTRRELRERPAAEVDRALGEWIAKQSSTSSEGARRLTEAMWISRGIGRPRLDLMHTLAANADHHARAAAVRMLRHWHGQAGPSGVALLAKAAEDSSGLVRLEAAISASHVGGKEAYEAVMPIMHGPMGDHLRYALACSFGSEGIRKVWESDPAANAMVSGFLRAASIRGGKLTVNRQASNPKDKAFDAEKSLATVEIATVPERMLFTPTEFTVKTGQPVKLVVSNPDLMQHNLLIVQPGALEEVGTAANEMAKDPNGVAKHFIPASNRILHATKLLEPNTGQVLRFNAPKEPGVYPYVCTFPGHWVIMNGKMVVTP
jgi:uncharacterized cupredoxin-like copper-binding protein/lysophospholipase L1-like esterase